MLQWRESTSLAATIATSVSARCAISEAASTTVTVFVRSAKNSAEPTTAIASAQCVKRRVASTTAIARAGYARCVGKVEIRAAIKFFYKGSVVRMVVQRASRAGPITYASSEENHLLNFLL